MSNKINIRNTFLADTDCVLVRCDLSQIEDRVCKMYCGTPRMVELANRKPWDYDAHTENAKAIFQKKEITKDERYLGKKVVHGCVDGQTEVLTERGFVRAPHLTEWDKVAQWNKFTHEITFVKPERFWIYSYTGKMLRFTGGFVSQYVTTDHRMVYKSNGNVKVCLADDFPKGGVIPLNGFHSGDVCLEDDFIRLLVAFQADGTIMNKNRVRWKFKKRRKIDRLRDLLFSLDYNHKEKKQKDGSTTFDLSWQTAKDLLYWMPDKKYSSRFLDLNATEKNILISELPYWDGSFRDNCDTFVYRSSDFDNISWVQTLCHLSSMKASIIKHQATESSYRDEVSYSLNISSFKYSTIKDKPHIEYKKDFPVYCITVPSGFFVMRRNGKVSITGNSQRKLQGNRMSESISKDTSGEVFIHPRQCDRLIRVYLETFWEIEKIYFPWVEERVQQDGMLVSSWGRRFDVRHRRIDNDLYREAYSWYMQAENADWTNQYLFLPTYHYMMGKYGWPPNAQVHDEVIGSVPFKDAYEMALVMSASAQQTREIPKGSGNYLCVPAGITVARTYGDKKGVEFKRLPGREEFYKQLKEEGGF